MDFFPYLSASGEPLCFSDTLDNTSLNPSGTFNEPVPTTPETIAGVVNTV